MEARLSFDGKGGSLIGRFFGGAILSLLTAGLFLPWFLVWMARWHYENSRMSTPAGEVRFEFTGGGARLLGLMLVNGILVILTLGIYAPWALADTIHYLYDSSVARGPDSRPWRLHFDGTGGEAFPILIKGFLLSVITFGIYAPWFLCELSRWVARRSRLDKDGAPGGTAAFDGAGGELLVTFLIGYLLTLATLGIYSPWFQVSLWRHFAGHTKVTVNGSPWTADFTGTGWDWALTLVVGFLLTAVTLGIYLPWFVARQARFRIGNLRFLSADAIASRPAFKPAFPGA